MNHYSAVVTQPIDGYTGPCKLQITKTAIIVYLSSGDELATWLFNCIRQFNAVDCYFSFTSGRRGPYGVGDYCFELPQKKVSEIQKAISGHTGAIFGHNRNYGGSALSASINVSNPSKPTAPSVADSSTRSYSESEKSTLGPLSSNLYPVTSPSKSKSYQNTGIGRVAAPPLPSKVAVKTVSPQNDAGLLSSSPASKMEAKYVNAMKYSPKPLPRTKPSVMKTSPFDSVSGATVNSAQNENGQNVATQPQANGSVSAPKLPQKSSSKLQLEMNHVGGWSDTVNYDELSCSPHGPNTVHASFLPPPPTNSGYSDVDYDVIRRNRELGKFVDPEGVYSEITSRFGNVGSSSLQAAGDTYDVPRPSRVTNFENIPDVYDDEAKQTSPAELYDVPLSNRKLSPGVEQYDVPPIRKLTGPDSSQTYDVPLKQNQTYAFPVKQPLPEITNDASPQDLYDVPQSSRSPQGGAAGGMHETYDVVPSHGANSQSQLLILPSGGGKKQGYENIGPSGEILGEIVADRLRQDLLDSLSGPAHCRIPRPLKETKHMLSRSCEFLNDVGRETTTGGQVTKRSGTNYKRLIIPEQEIHTGGTLPPSSWHTYKLHRRLSGSLGNLPAAIEDDDTYVVLDKTNKPEMEVTPPVVGPKPDYTLTGTDRDVRGAEPMMDDIASGDVYIAMKGSPSHSVSATTPSDKETLPLGYVRMGTAKQALSVKKSNSSFDLGRKETSSADNEGRRNSDLVWPGNSGWSQWTSQNEPERKISSDSEVFSPPAHQPPAADHPVVVSKPSVRPKRSILLQKNTSSQSKPAGSSHEKRLGSLSPEGKMATVPESPHENTAPTVNADGTPRHTYINLPKDNEEDDDIGNYNIEKLKANRLKKHAYDEIDGVNFKKKSIKKQPTVNSEQGKPVSETSRLSDLHMAASNCSQLASKYENWNKGDEKFNKRYEPLKSSD